MMTTTSFYDPRLLTNVTVPNEVTATNSIDWNFSSTLLQPQSPAITKKSLYTISGIWMEKFRSSTSQLWCTHFNIPDVGCPITGIELGIDLLRGSRIEDLIIQLTKDGTTLVGENRASTINPVQSDMYTGNVTVMPVPVNDNTIYGSSTDLWGTTWTSAEIAASTFGVVLSFQSNQILPHSDLAYLYQASIRVSYA